MPPKLVLTPLSLGRPVPWVGTSSFPHPRSQTKAVIGDVKDKRKREGGREREERGRLLAPPLGPAPGSSAPAQVL